jgi:hypothetical protein
MTRWTQGMHACGVTHLRSPASVHPAATDKEALLAFAAATGRQSELVEAQALWEGSRKSDSERRDVGRLSCSGFIMMLLTLLHSRFAVRRRLPVPA